MKKKKLWAVLVVIILAVILLVWCSKGAVDGMSQATSSENRNAAEEAQAEEMQTEEPQKEETQAEGAQKEETETEGQKKVVASSVAVVQILDALGVPMVGVPTSSYELPESVADAVEIGNPMSPDLEVITSLEPDVIVSVDTLSADLQSQFDTVGADSLFVNLSSYDGLKETITTLGDYFGAGDKAAEIIAGFEEKETAVSAAVEGKENPSVLIIFGASGSFMVASEETYVGDLVKRGGGENVIEDAPAAFSPVDMEYLADKNPDYILFMAHANPEESLEAFKTEFETNEAWQNFDAVKNDRVVALPTSYFGMSANLLAPEALEKLVEILYTE